MQLRARCRRRCERQCDSAPSIGLKRKRIGGQAIGYGGGHNVGVQVRYRTVGDTSFWCCLELKRRRKNIGLLIGHGVRLQGRRGVVITFSTTAIGLAIRNRRVWQLGVGCFLFTTTIFVYENRCVLRQLGVGRGRWRQVNRY
jgi:hypothetical protein